MTHSAQGAELVAPMIGARPELVERVQAITADIPGLRVEPVNRGEGALELLQLEMPEAYMVDLANPDFDALAILQAASEDPWLIGGGVVAIYTSTAQLRPLRAMRSLNLVAEIAVAHLAEDLPVVLSLLRDNRRLLAQRALGLDIVPELSARFVLRNHILEARCYANLLAQMLYGRGWLDCEAQQGLRVGLAEILINGIEHGNCAISAEDKERLVEEGDAYTHFLRARCAEADAARRRVELAYTIQEGSLQFEVRDAGSGFDWQKALDKLDSLDPLASSGRGLPLIHQAFPGLRFNPEGNMVTVSVPLRDQAEPLRPRLFERSPASDYAAGDFVVREGEPGSTLYYIVRGEFEVLMGGRSVGRIGVDDLLLGEMAFLLGGRRTASVRALTPATLVPVPRDDLVHALRDHPQYGLFLARLLAQRLRRAGAGESALNP